jgi:NitT/TauT family transport system ATP-binding protein
MASERERETASVGGEATGRIEFQSVSHAYRSRRGGRVLALHDIDLDVSGGEFITIVGPSGCGKTTLLRVAAGLTQASAGSVRLDGAEVRRPHQKVGVVFQQPILLPWLTVLGNVLLPANLAKTDMEAAKARARELLDLVELTAFADAYPGELSGGMQQRVGICRALINDPEVLLMDEPFAALDALTRDRMSVELQRIWMNSGKTVVFITHSINEAVFLADRVAVMTPRPGRIAEIIDVPFARPRDLAVLSTERGGALMRRVRDHFDKDGEGR